MARATTRTLLSLDRFAQIVGIHPLHFNQVHIAGIPTCGNTILQYPWQSAGRVSREDIALAIKSSEDKVAAELGYDIAPRWVTDELVRVNSWSWTGKASRGMILVGGVEALSLIEEDAPVTFDTRFAKEPTRTTPLDNTEYLGYQELAIVDVEVADGVVASEISVFYPASAGFNSGGDYAWEIRPVRIEIADGRATITFRREQLVVPALLEEFVALEVNGLDDDAFLGSVDVYRHYNDLSNQVQFRYRSSCCCLSGCAQCTYTTHAGCLIPTYSRMGHVSLAPSTWDGEAHVLSLDDMCLGTPEGAVLQYKAGYEGPDAQAFERIVAHLALAELGQSLCDCSGIENKFDYYTTDLVSGVSPVGGSDSKQRVYKDPSPLGSTRAAFEAWEYVKNKALGRGLVSV